MTKLKNFLFASITVLLSTILTFSSLNLGTNVFAMQFFHQENLPRGWQNHIGRFYRTLYTQAHDGILDEWTAILGDSYAEGAGDAYLSGDRKYSLAHYLREQRLENFLIFGRSGFGSISAVQEFLIASQEFSDAWFLPDLDRPNEIIFLFYEGNDLTDNLRHRMSEKFEHGHLPSFVINEITQPSDFLRRIDYYLPLLRPVYLQTRSIVLSARQLTAKKSSTTFDLSKKYESEVNNFLVQDGQFGSRNIEVANVLQSAATELSREELDLAIEVFFECLDFVSRNFPASELSVVYLPSPVTVYKWNDPVRTKTFMYPERNSTTKKENDQYSEYIRNQIRSYTMGTNIRFIDSTDELRAAAESRVLHGPKDWKHFNAEGYLLLSKIIDSLRGL